MQTFIIYNFILLWATFFGFLYEKSQVKGTQRLYWFLSFLVPFLFLALRYEIGTDYRNYVVYFYKITNGEVILKEPAYLFINKVIAELGLDVQWLFVIFGFLFITFSYKALPKKGFSVGVFIFICELYLYEGFSLLRQGLATAIMAYGIRYIVEKEFIKYLLLSFLAMLFHLGTGFILLLVYPIVLKEYNRWLMLIFLFSIYFIVINTNILFDTMILFVSFFPKYAWYLNSKYMEVASISSGLGILSKLGVGAIILFLKNMICDKYKNANVIINLYFIYLIFIILHMEIIVLRRIEHMFIFSQVLALIYFVLALRERDRLFVLPIIFIFFLAMFNKYIATGTLEINNDIYINPYQTILNK